MASIGYSYVQAGFACPLTAWALLSFLLGLSAHGFWASGPRHGEKAHLITATSGGECYHGDGKKVGTVGLGKCPLASRGG